MNPELKFTFHKSFDGYVAKLNIPKSVVKESTDQPNFILLLDRSGSMGQNVTRIINNILPTALNKLGYKPDDTIYIVTYDSIADVYKPKLKDLPSINICSRGSTNLEPGLDKLRQLFSLLDNKVRLLHISDGNIWDIDEAIKKSESSPKVIKNLFFKIINVI